VAGHKAFVSIGSNIDPAANVRAAVLRLGQWAHLKGVSTVYRSAALERPEQPPYYNCVAMVETDATPVDVRHALRRAEAELGRQRTPDKYAARTIDLDLILYDELVLDTETLKLPDPDILERPFLAVPLWEMAPDLVLPGLHLPISKVAASLSSEGMEALEEFTKQLRRDAGLEP
jgi:2-amino-4-hydroxy-6-hydroxymethyldihydropteridine diphosphokinase